MPPSYGVLMPSLIWTEQKTIIANTSDFERCVTIAVEKIQGVSVERGLSNIVNIVLNVKTEKPIPFLIVNVQKRGSNTIEIIFAGNGTRASDEEHATIMPLIDSIADAIHAQCEH